MIKYATLWLLCFLPMGVSGELISLEDDELSNVDGAGVGLVLEDFLYNAGEEVNGGTFEISGLQGRNNNGPEQDVVLEVSQFYVAGEGSALGTNVNGNPVNLGRLLFPYNIELLDGDTIGVPDRGVLEFSAPAKLNSNPYIQTVRENRTERRAPGAQVATGTRVERVTGLNDSVLSSRAGLERADVGIRFDLEIGGNRSQSLENHIQGLALDGSRVRLWGGAGHLEGELAINLYASNLIFFACNDAGNNCGDRINFNNIAIESELGFGAEQPVTFEVDPTGNFTFVVGSLEGKCGSVNGTGGCADAAGRAFFNNYYANGPATNVHIGNVNVGNRNFGSSTISNLQIQYLEVKSHDL